MVQGFIKTAPDEISGFFAFLTVPDNPHFPDAYRRKKSAASSGVIREAGMPPAHSSPSSS